MSFDDVAEQGCRHAGAVKWRGGRQPFCGALPIASSMLCPLATGDEGSTLGSCMQPQAACQQACHAAALTNTEGDKGGHKWVAHAIRRVGCSSQVGLQLLLAARSIGQAGRGASHADQLGNATSFHRDVVAEQAGSNSAVAQAQCPAKGQWTGQRHAVTSKVSGCS